MDDITCIQEVLISYPHQDVKQMESASYRVGGRLKINYDVGQLSWLSDVHLSNWTGPWIPKREGKEKYIDPTVDLEPQRKALSNYANTKKRIQFRWREKSIESIVINYNMIFKDWKKVLYQTIHVKKTRRLILCFLGWPKISNELTFRGLKIWLEMVWLLPLHL